MASKGHWIATNAGQLEEDLTGKGAQIKGLELFSTGARHWDSLAS